jgi:hypothetical protein
MSHSTKRRMEPCYTCGLDKPDVEPAYLRVVGAGYYIVGARVAWLNFRCHSCEECFQRGAAIVRHRIWVVALWVMLPLSIILGAYGILHLAVRADQVLISVIMVTGLLWLAGTAALPFYLSWWSRTKTPAYLGPTRDEQLRHQAGIRRWGARRHLVVLRELPPTEAAVELR